MATRHLMLPMGEYKAPLNGAALALAGRTRLTATLLLAATTAAVSVVIEASATGAAWVTLATLASAAPGVVEKLPVDITVQPYHRFVRARLETVTVATLEVALLAPWMDSTVDGALFSKELRGFADGFARLVAEAEELVMRELTPRAPSSGRPVTFLPDGAVRGQNVYTPEVVSGLTSAEAELLAGAPQANRIDADMSLPGFGDAIRKAIVRQAEHAFQRHKLSQRIDAPALVSLRSFPEMAPGLMEWVRHYRNASSTVWRGR